MHTGSPEYGSQTAYLEFALKLPWNQSTKDTFDLKHTRQILDKHHFGLKHVKERIVEYLAVLKLKQDAKAPILCLVGPPGVGKTSLGQSIAEALGRSYTRMAFGGLHDEAEIRGHRKTYIGAKPGRILQSLKRAECNNPVFVLTRSIKLVRIFAVIHHPPYLRCLIPSRMLSSMTIIWNTNLTFPTYSLLPRQMISVQFQLLCEIV